MKKTEKPVVELPDARETPIDSALTIRQRYNTVFEKYTRPIATVDILRDLTHNLTAMVHEGDMLCEILTEPYNMLLPVKGRTEALADARVIDVFDIPNQEVKTCILNETMFRALADAGKEKTVVGRQFAFRCHDMVADKRYRMVEVKEVTITHADIVPE